MPPFIKTILAACALAFLNSPAQAQSYDYVKEMRTATDICLSFVKTGQVDAGVMARNKMQPKNKKNTVWIKQIFEGKYKLRSLVGTVPHNLVEITFEFETNKRRVGQHDCEIALGNVVGPSQSNSATPTERAIGDAFYKRVTAKGFKPFRDSKGNLLYTDGTYVLYARSQSKSSAGFPRSVYSKIGVTVAK
jgi:hypothetical protein